MVGRYFSFLQPNASRYFYFALSLEDRSLKPILDQPSVAIYIGLACGQLAHFTPKKPTSQVNPGKLWQPQIFPLTPPQPRASHLRRSAPCSSRPPVAAGATAPPSAARVSLLPRSGRRCRATRWPPPRSPSSVGSLPAPVPSLPLLPSPLLCMDLAISVQELTVSPSFSLCPQRKR